MVSHEILTLVIHFIMRKFLTALAFVMLLLTSFTANAKDDDKKDKQKPVKLGVFEWLFPWPPVYRIAPMEESIDCNTIDIVTIDGITIESECE